MSALIGAILKRFCQPEWATFFEVRDATGHAGSRSADAVAMNCYPSRGLEIYGIEIKSSRSDWMREMRNPDKSVAVQQFCDRWYLVTLPDIVKDGELPATWGLMELRGGVLRQMKEAPKLDAKPISKKFAAAMLRSACKAIDDRIPGLMEGEKLRLQTEYDDRLNRARENMRGEGLEIVKNVEKIKAATGIDLTNYRGSSKFIEAIKFALQADLNGWSGITGLINSLKHIDEISGKMKASIAEAAKANGIDLQ